MHVAQAIIEDEVQHPNREDFTNAVHKIVNLCGSITLERTGGSPSAPTSPTPPRTLYIVCPPSRLSFSTTQRTLVSVRGRVAKSTPSTQVQNHFRRKKEAFITLTSSLASSELELDMVGGGGGGGS